MSAELCTLVGLEVVSAGFDTIGTETMAATEVGKNAMTAEKDEAVNKHRRVL